MKRLPLTQGLREPVGLLGVLSQQNLIMRERLQQTYEAGQRHGLFVPHTLLPATHKSVCIKQNTYIDVVPDGEGGQWCCLVPLLVGVGDRLRCLPVIVHGAGPKAGTAVRMQGAVKLVEPRGRLTLNPVVPPLC